MSVARSMMGARNERATDSEPKGNISRSFLSSLLRISVSLTLPRLSCLLVYYADHTESRSSPLYTPLPPPPSSSSNSFSFQVIYYIIVGLKASPVLSRPNDLTAPYAVAHVSPRWAYSTGVTSHRRVCIVGV